MPTRQADYTRRLDLLTSACYSCSPSRPLSLWKNKRETTTKSKTEEKEEKKRVYAGKREHLVTFNSPIVTSKSYIWRSCPPLLNWGIQEQTRLTGVNKTVTADLLLTWSVMSHLFNSVLGKIWIYLFKKGLPIGGDLRAAGPQKRFLIFQLPNYLLGVIWLPRTYKKARRQDLTSLRMKRWRRDNNEDDEGDNKKKKLPFVILFSIFSFLNE